MSKNEILGRRLCGEFRRSLENVNPVFTNLSRCALNSHDMRAHALWSSTLYRVYALRT